MLIDFEGSRTAADGALVAFDEGDPEGPVLASVAKAHCGPAYLRMATESAQIQGGVGYTWEYDAHLYTRRAFASKAFLGDETLHQERLAMSVARGLDGEGAGHAT
jgi:acyl-CoA dehydrogenase